MKPILKTDYRKKRVTQRIELAQVLVARALETPKILRKLNEFGYGAPMLREGLAAAERARSSRRRPAPGSPEVTGDAVDFPRRLESALAEGLELRRVARLAFARDRISREQLELSFPLPDTRFLMLQVLERLAHTLLIEEKFLHAMAAHGMVTPQIDAIARRLSVMRVASVEWRQATERREQAFAEQRQNIALLDRWMSDFFKVAKAALYDDPPALEAVGVTVVARPVQKR